MGKPSDQRIVQYNFGFPKEPKDLEKDREGGIATTLSDHARRMAQNRGIPLQTLGLVLQFGKSRKLRSKARAIWIPPERRRRLVLTRGNPSEMDRCAGVRLILVDDVVVTVEHTLKRRHWA